MISASEAIFTSMLVVYLCFGVAAPLLLWAMLWVSTNC
jgi:hypothetical protein